MYQFVLGTLVFSITKKRFCFSPQPKGRIQLKGNLQHIQSCLDQQNPIQSHHMSKRVPLTIQSTKTMYEFQKTALTCISPGMLFIRNFQRKMTLLHHPNSSMAYFHSQTQSPEIDDDNNNYDCNLISTDSGAQPCDEYETIFEAKEDEMKCERNKQALQIQQQFREIRDTANKRMFELQEDFGKMQRISFEFECLTELSSYDEKFASLAESLAQLQKAISASDTKFHKMSLGQQNLMRVAREINQRSKLQSEYNDEIVATNSRHLTRLQLKLNNITKELMKQSIVLDEWKSAPEQSYDQLKADFVVMLDQRLDGVKDNLYKQRCDNFYYHLTLCGLVLVLIGTVSFHKIIA